MGAHTSIVWARRETAKSDSQLTKWSLVKLLILYYSCFKAYATNSCFKAYATNSCFKAYASWTPLLWINQRVENIICKLPLTECFWINVHHPSCLRAERKPSAGSGVPLLLRFSFVYALSVHALRSSKFTGEQSVIHCMNYILLSAFRALFCSSYTTVFYKISKPRH